MTLDLSVKGALQDVYAGAQRVQHHLGGEMTYPLASRGMDVNPEYAATDVTSQLDHAAGVTAENAIKLPGSDI